MRQPIGRNIAGGWRGAQWAVGESGIVRAGNDEWNKKVGEQEGEVGVEGQELPR